MSKSLLLACAAMLMGGVSTAFAQSNLDGWDKLKEMPSNPGDYYYVITTGQDKLMMGLGAINGDGQQQRHWTMFYQEPTDPMTDVKKVWTIQENSTGGYTFGNLESPGVYFQTVTGGPWYFRIMVSDDVDLPESNFTLEYADDMWKIKNSNVGYVGPWEEKAIVAGMGVAGNKSGDFIDKYNIYAMTRTDYDAAYKGTDVTYRYITNPQMEGKTGWTLTGEVAPQHNGERPTGYFERWEASTNRSASQTFTVAKTGIYKLSADIVARNTTHTITLTQGSTTLGTTTLTNSEWANKEIEFELTDISTPLTVTFKGEDASEVNHWFAIDNVKLNYYGNATGVVAAAYNEVQAKVAKLDAAGQAKFAELTAEVKAAIDADNVPSAQKDAYVATVNNSYLLAVKAQTTPGTNMTEAIQSPAFDGGVSTGWTMNGFVYNSWTLNGAQCYEKYAQDGALFAAGTMTQTITGLHAGVYAVNVGLVARNWSATLTVAQGDNTQTATVEKTPDAFQDTKVVLVLDEGDLVITVSTPEGTSPNPGNYWVAVDNFRLTYLGTPVEVLNGAIAEAQARVDAAKGFAGDGALQINQKLIDEKQAEIDAQKAVAENPASTDAQIEAATKAANAIVAPTQLNAPAEGQRFKLVQTYAGWTYDNQAATFMAGDRSDDGGFNIKYRPQNDNAAQAFILTQVEGNNYTLSQIDAEGNQRYVCSKHYWGDTNNFGSIRTITEADKALVVTIMPTSKAGVYTMYNVAAKNYIGSQDQGFFTVNSHIDFKIVEAQKLTVNLNVAEKQYTTLMLPFDAAIPAGVAAYTVANVDDKVQATPVTGTFKANTPYVVVGTTGVDTQLSGWSVANPDKQYSAGLLTGTYTQITDVAGKAVYAPNGAIVPAVEAIAPYTAYMTEVPTAIASVKADTADGTIYDLAGRRVVRAQKGLYIINGKKVVK